MQKKIIIHTSSYPSRRGEGYSSYINSVRFPSLFPSGRQGLKKNGKRSLIYLIFILMAVVLSKTAIAQQPLSVPIPESQDITHYPTEMQYQSCNGLLYPSSNNKSEWMVRVKNLSPHPSFNTDSLNIIKAKAMEAQSNYKENVNAPSAQYKAFVVDSPLIGSNFEGNIYNSFSPLDNSVAISNGGIIVSVTNAMIRYYSTNGSLLFNSSLEAFFNKSSLTFLYDPRVIYDSEADRFIFVVLNGGASASDSKIMLNFSKTNNPSDGWWNYELSGPFVYDSSVDFPNIGISDKDFFVTGNLFAAGSLKGTIIYQIEKQKCYNGSTMNYKLWKDITDSNGQTYTIVPVSYGHQGNYGPGMFFVSSKALGGNYINLYRITDEVNANPQLNVYSIAVSAYSISGDAQQKGINKPLSVQNTQMLSGFYLNNKIHCVSHANYNNSGFAGIFYYKIDVTTRTVAIAKYGKNGFNYAYPSIASFGSKADEEDVIIGFENSGATIYPEIRAVVCNGNMEWSNDVLIKQGKGYVSMLTGSKEQWGDYTTLARKYNSTYPSAWFSASYGANTHVYKTWITELYPANAILNIKQPQLSEVTPVTIYPNPVYESFQIEFELNKSEFTTITITDINGKLVKELYAGILKEGKNVLGFNKQVLAQGIYLINIKTTNQLIKQEKLIIN